MKNAGKIKTCSSCPKLLAQFFHFLLIHKFVLVWIFEDLLWSCIQKFCSFNFRKKIIACLRTRILFKVLLILDSFAPNIVNCNMYTIL